MPSFRIELEIGDLRPGRGPEEVMAAARASLEHHIDASDIAVTRGVPRIVLRFTVPDSSDAEENAIARLAAVRTRDAVEAVAETGELWIRRRRRAHWLPLG